MLTLNHIDDEREVEECAVNDVELFEPREDAAVAFEAPEKALDLVARLVGCAVVVPFDQPVGLGRHLRVHTEVERQLPGLVALIGAVHDQGDALDGPVPACQQGTAFGRIMCIAARQAESQGKTVICRDQVDLGVPPAALSRVDRRLQLRA